MAPVLSVAALTVLLSSVSLNVQGYAVWPLRERVLVSGESKVADAHQAEVQDGEDSINQMSDNALSKTLEKILMKPAETNHVGQRGANPTDLRGFDSGGHKGPGPSGRRGPGSSGNQGPGSSGHSGSGSSGNSGSGSSGNQGSGSSGNQGSGSSGNQGSGSSGHSGSGSSGYSGSGSSGYSGSGSSGYSGSGSSGFSGSGSSGYRGSGSSGYSGSGSPGATKPCTTQVKVPESVTYNAELHPTALEGYEQRRARFLETIQNGDLPGEVVCLQEIWLEDDIREIVSVAQEEFPYSVSVLGQTSGGNSSLPDIDQTITAPACGANEVGDVLSCLRYKCRSKSRFCLIKRCDDELRALPQDCLSCILQRHSGSDDDDDQLFPFEELCMSSPYTTTYGLLLLSKQPIEVAEVVSYHEGYSLFIPRAYIRAKVSGVHVFCTHLAATMNKGYYMDVGPFKSYHEQNLYELAVLLNEALPVLHRSILLGDFNSGPKVPSEGIKAVKPLCYDVLTRNYFSPFVESVPSCTWCVDNPLTSARRDSIIDHILVPKCMRGVITQEMYPVRIFDGEDPMSSHYGVVLLRQEVQGTTGTAGTSLTTVSTGYSNTNGVTQSTGGSTKAQTSGVTSPQTSGVTSPQTSGATNPPTSGATSPPTSGATSPQTSGATKPQTSAATKPQTSGATSPQTSGATKPPTSGLSTPPTTSGPSSNSTSPAITRTTVASQLTTAQADDSEPILLLRELLRLIKKHH
ncbi:uncharacterized protein LOC106152798 [Lingula anatina]|uniref:Uncharacterized protein LOC106152798 n=1 Tax=Lingula anatina TaxID=7574 RepID=A0A1S3H7N5_LINAN|nr:uncharacterized protein LOC106152798 [Lingula anatina]|eukprot:XP_013381987.1 uncharacterized protein LOC106152798 [Lingula anatina]